MGQLNMQTLPKSAKQKERDRMRLQKKFQKQFGVRQKWDQKSQVTSPLMEMMLETLPTETGSSYCTYTSEQQSPIIFAPRTSFM